MQRRLPRMQRLVSDAGDVSRRYVRLKTVSRATMINFLGQCDRRKPTCTTCLQQSLPCIRRGIGNATTGQTEAEGYVIQTVIAIDVNNLLKPLFDEQQLHCWASSTTQLSEKPIGSERTSNRTIKFAKWEFSIFDEWQPVYIIGCSDGGVS